jgi:hypothetical protein
MNSGSKRWIVGAGGAILGTLTWGSLLFGGTGEVSFTPTGLKISIMRIALSVTADSGQPQSEQILYSCPHATEEECLVDVTNQPELDAIAAQATTVAVQAGTYDAVSLDLCAPGKNGVTPVVGLVRGVFTVSSEGKTYATEADASNVTGLMEVAAGTDAAAEFTAIGNWTCKTKSVVLREPMVVINGATTPLTVVVDAKFIASSTSHVSPGMGGCRGQANGQARGVCVSYPSIFPLVGDINPELDRFVVAHHRTDPNAIDDTKANGYVVVARGADGGAPLTAFVRPYYSETSATPTQGIIQDSVYGGPGYFGETIVPSFMVVGDASVSFVTGGSLDNGAIFQDFHIADHKGVVETHEAGSWQYHAIALP